jgi:aminopeptidase N
MPTPRPLTILGAAVLVGVLAACGTDSATSAPDDSAPPTSEVFDPSAVGGAAPPPEPDELEIAGATTAGDPYTPGAGSTGFAVGHYALDLTWDPESARLEGTAKVTVRPQEELTTLALDLADSMAVAEVRVDGELAEAEQGGDELVITPAAPLATGVDVTVEVRYAGEPGVVAAEPSLGELGWLEADDTTFAIGQPFGSAAWYPVNDHPSDKATYAIAVTVPEGLEVASNGNLVEHQDDGEQTTWRWEVAQPMASHLSTVVIGDMEVVEATGPHGLPLVSFFPADDPEMAADFASTGRMIEVFESLFGPYPFDSYGAIVVPDALGFALETQNRPIYGTDTTSEELQVHELAHQWFGDSVTPDRWADLWLNEGFATYAELLWREQTEADFDVDATIADFGGDEDVTLGPILNPGYGRLFDPAVYYRGAATLHALRREVGDPTFFSILRSWTTDHRDGNVTTEDFVALASDQAGEDLSPLFDVWLLKVAYPPS